LGRLENPANRNNNPEDSSGTDGMIDYITPQYEL
jgi:hypothetical protein